MKYIDLHNYLKKIVNYENKEIVIDEKIIVQNYNFESAYRFLLPGEPAIKVLMSIVWLPILIMNRILYNP